MIAGIAEAAVTGFALYAMWRAFHRRMPTPVKGDSGEGTVYFDTDGGVTIPKGTVLRHANGDYFITTKTVESVEHTVAWVWISLIALAVALVLDLAR